MSCILIATKKNIHFCTCNIGDGNTPPREAIGSLSTGWVGQPALSVNPATTVGGRRETLSDAHFHKVFRPFLIRIDKMMIHLNKLLLFTLVLVSNVMIDVQRLVWRSDWPNGLMFDGVFDGDCWRFLYGLLSSHHGSRDSRPTSTMNKGCVLRKVKRYFDSDLSCLLVWIFWWA